jgi:cobalt-zinc-cadmium efflux system membrane fusion protein
MSASHDYQNDNDSTMITPGTSMRTVLLLLALAAVGCSKKDAKPAPAAKVQNAVTESQLTTVTLTSDAVRRLGIATAAVDSLGVLPTRTVGGEIVVPPGLSLTVAAPVAGRVLAPESGALPLAGARVARGATLLRLAPLPPDLAVAERDQEVASARLRQAQAEAERTSKLFADRLVSARDNERAQADLSSARATAEAAGAQLRLVRGGSATGGLSTLHVSAPGDGVVRAVHAAPGQTVAAGAPLVEVMRIDRLWVRVPVYAGDAARVRRGAPAMVHGLGGPQTGAAIVASAVAAPPSGDPNASSVDLYYEVRGSAGQLRPGERVGVTLALSAASASERGLAVPLAALVRDMSGGSWVYERTDSVTFVRRRVEVARVANGYAILALGPKKGTTVVTSGAAELFGTEFGAGK